MKNYLASLLLLALLLLGGCASTSNTVATLLRSQVAGANYVGAFETIKTDKFYKRKESLLLRDLEKGMIYFRQKEYSKSLALFEKARETSDALYTKSISKKVLSMMTNSNSDNYYGERYERSLIRFYLALNNYMIFQQGFKMIPDPKVGAKKVDLKKKDRINYLSAARAYILEWDSVLKNFQAVEAGKSVYKNDMTAKVFGAFIHEEIGSRNDRQIAKQLYTDARKLIVRNYGAYPSINFKSKSYRANYEKFPKLGVKSVKKQFLSLTPHGKDLDKFLKKQQKRIKSKKKSKVIKVLISNNLIAKKKPRKIDIHVPIISLSGISVRGAMGFGTFVRKMLSAAQGTRPSITFELPEVEKRSTKYRMELLVKDLKGKVVTKSDAVIINPISDMAHEALDEKIASIRTKVGTRIALKHAAALAAAYGTYKAMYKKSGFFAFIAATAGYAVANKAIAASEQADVRFWATLPHDVRMADLKLRPGRYHFFINKRDPHGNLQVTDLGQTKVGKNTKLLNFSTF